MNPRSPSHSYPLQASGDGHVDEELLRRMAAGDEQALGILHDRWSSRIYSLAFAILRDASEAEDVTEETFWQSWRQANRFEDARGSASSWLLMIARSRSLDRLRARRRRPEETLEETEQESQTFIATSPTPDEQAELSERSTRVRAALQQLPTEQREALELAYFGGLSQSEIAERTRLPLGTVKTRMRLALGKLRESLSELRDDVVPKEVRV